MHPNSDTQFCISLQGISVFWNEIDLFGCILVGISKRGGEPLPTRLYFGWLTKLRTAEAQRLSHAENTLSFYIWIGNFFVPELGFIFCATLRDNFDLVKAEDTESLFYARRLALLKPEVSAIHSSFFPHTELQNYIC